MIISVGYRVNSKKGIIFRKWANKILKNYLVEGYVVNEKRLSDMVWRINMKISDNLTKEEKIKKMKLDNKIRLLMMCFFLPIIIGLGIYLIVLKEPRELGIGFLLCVPVSLLLGYILPVRDNNKKIKELER